MSGWSTHKPCGHRGTRLGRLLCGSVDVALFQPLARRHTSLDYALLAAYDAFSITPANSPQVTPVSNQTNNSTAPVLHPCRDEAAAELSRERALWELLELFFVQPPTAHGTAAEVSGWTPDPGSSSA